MFLLTIKTTDMISGQVYRQEFEYSSDDATLADVTADIDVILAEQETYESVFYSVVNETRQILRGFVPAPDFQA
jgi:hypothetical protein